MHFTEPPEHESAVHRLKEEIDWLTKEQSEALLTATYLGMTPDEAKEYDSRRDKILKLVEQLRQLEKAQ
jgi:Asp-tRNA(Asn)/Glu-tRNA(Gln) amidotransferase C subunit